MCLVVLPGLDIPGSDGLLHNLGFHFHPPETERLRGTGDSHLELVP